MTLVVLIVHHLPQAHQQRRSLDVASSDAREVDTADPLVGLAVTATANIARLETPMGGVVISRHGSQQAAVLLKRTCTCVWIASSTISMSGLLEK